MNVAISGATGMIASYLIPHLRSLGHSVVPLLRADFDPHHKEVLEEKISMCDGVVNLAGLKLYKSRTCNSRREVYNSRVQTTRLLVEVVNQMPRKPKMFFSASMVACYPSNRIYQEEEVIDASFVGNLCQGWETEAQAIDPTVRLVIGRIGVVLAPERCVMRHVVRPMHFGIVATVGDGSSYFSWVHIDDLVRMITQAIEDDTMRGVFNFTAPEVTTNREFMLQVATILGKGCCVQIPKRMFRWLVGHRADLVGVGHGAVPARLVALGFSFRYPKVGEAVRALLAEEKRRKRA